MPQVIFENFAAGLDDLNNEIVSDMMLPELTAAGRAYKIEKMGCENGSRLVKKIAEPYVGRIHFCSIAENLDKHAVLLKKLRRDSSCNGAAYAGVAGFLNFSYIAAARPSAVVLFDVNCLQRLFWKAVIGSLAAHEKPLGFVRSLEAIERDLSVQIRRDFRNAATEIGYAIYRGTATDLAARIEKWAALGFPDNIMRRHEMVDYEWLKPQAYQYLHKLAQHNAIGAITLDITDRNAMMQLRDYLRTVPCTAVPANDNGKDISAPVARQGAIAGLGYVSNIFAFLRMGHDFCQRQIGKDLESRARKNLAGLFESEKAMVVDSGSKNDTGNYEGAQPSIMLPAQNFKILRAV